MKQSAEITKVEGADAAMPKKTFTAVAVTPMMNPMRRNRRLLLLQSRKEAIKAPPIIAAIGMRVEDNRVLKSMRPPAKPTISK
ncbi:MAG: hypothetical protein V1857_05230 [archaeon]